MRNCSGARWLWGRLPLAATRLSASPEGKKVQHTLGVELTGERRLALVGALAKEKGWDTKDAERVIDALYVVEDGPLVVRDDYQDLAQKDWSNEEVIDAALDYFGL